MAIVTGTLPAYEYRQAVLLESSEAGDRQKMDAALHDAYAADYDHQAQVYGCYIPDSLFGLGYEFTQPGQELLDLGIGSGLSAVLFAKAGLQVWGMDFSPAMLAICAAKGIAVDLKQQDLQQVPWPYPDAAFDHAVSCGVFHFIPDLEGIFSEVERVVRPGGIFAFTTKCPKETVNPEQKYERVSAGEMDVFSHAPEYVEALIATRAFALLKTHRCLVGQDLFQAWVLQRK